MSRMVGVGSVKGAPGVTSLALVLAASWPRPVVLVEADPSGGDLTYRCRAAHGGVLHHRRTILSLAAAAHASPAMGRTDDVVLDHAQRLSCGVDVVAGCETSSQARGLRNLWADTVTALRRSPVDVILDLGRIDPAKAASAVPLNTVDVLVMLGASDFSSAVHLTEAVAELTAVCSARGVSVVPALTGPDATGERDCRDLDDMVRGCAVPPQRTVPVPVDPDALLRLEGGERVAGRLGRTMLLRRATQLARTLAGADDEVVTEVVTA